MLCSLKESLALGAKIFKDRAPKTSKDIAKYFISHATVDKNLSPSTFKLKIDENDSLKDGAHCSLELSSLF